MKVFKKLHTLFIAVLLLVAGQGCDTMIYDDLSECPQGVDFHFYSQTPCETTRDYPTQLKQIRLFAFDENEVLVGEYPFNNLTLSAENLQRTFFYRLGTFTFVAWGSDDLSAYEISSFKVGETTKQEMELSLVRQTEKPHATSLYYGVSAPLTIADRSQLGTIFDRVDINMIEFTNRIYLTVHGLPADGSFSVSVIENNASFLFNGNYAKSTGWVYQLPLKNEGNLFKADMLTLLKLAENRGTTLTVIDNKTNQPIFEADLVNDLILNREQATPPPYNLECERDFHIDIFLEHAIDPGTTWMIVRAIINNWNLVYRNVILGG